MNGSRIAGGALGAIFMAGVIAILLANFWQWLLFPAVLFLVIRYGSHPKPAITPQAHYSDRR